MLKAALISLDAMIAIPIAMSGILLLFFGYTHMVNTLTSISSNQAIKLNLYSKSEALLELIKYQDSNLSNSKILIGNYLLQERIAYSLCLPTFSNSSLCNATSICRILTISNKPYLLVLTNENTNKP